MVMGSKKWRITQIITFFCSMINLHLVGGEQLVPCMFIFGDSLVDNGNDNLLPTVANGNYWPYGIDFPTGPTGRFTNGRTTADIISDLLGFGHFIPPFQFTIGQEILDGVNFASAGAAITDYIPEQVGKIATFDKQIKNFKTIVSRIAVITGDEKSAENRVKKCIYSITIGSNDFTYNNLTDSNTGKNFSISQFVDHLIQQFSGQLWTLYGYGARKFVINGLGAGGCVPHQLATSSGQGETCPKSSLGNYYNGRLKKMVQNFNDNSDAKFIYINSAGILQEIFDNPSAHGFKVTNLACCGSGRNNGETLCPRFQTPCPNRTEYVFWDAYHPTEAANIFLANRAFHAEKPTDTYPFDIFHLAQL